ncbi:MAG: ThiF family adenylyltransferase, partial [Chloroflexota bacterium]|nr:ThiF family adenylyltransferase [Chloroflexota bacterium]
MSNMDIFFSRQRALDELDLDRLHASSAMVVGLGNVGGPAALELARAGVGRLLLVDRDEVAPENASRGIFCACDAGLPKAVAAAARIAELVPGVQVTPLIADARTDVPDTLFSASDALLIATDSWSSRMHANRWAHALPGRTKVVLTGGLTGLSWEVTSSVPGSGLGCSQCPHGAAVAGRDEEGGCGVQVRERQRRIDPSASFTGAVVASTMVMEACAALGGDGPRFAGRAVSFEYATGRYSV